MRRKVADKIIAVDFDGTLCENAWPGIGAPRQAVIDYVQDQQRRGAKLILWTNRGGEYLDAALDWCEDRGLVFNAVNENIPEMVEYFGNDCRKVFANEYIDDRAVPMPGESWALTAELSREFYYIREKLGKSELLAQLAEESAELAQAALKYRRALDGENPTPLSVKAAIDHLVEEIADVELCTALLSMPEDEARKDTIKRFKTTRWIDRLKEAARHGE